jgi:uroporphyrinogen decarboxylase
MEKRRRVLDAINHVETDVVPWQADFTHQELEKIIRHTGDADFARHVGNHIRSVYFDGYLEELPDRPGYFQDDYGILWNRNGADVDEAVSRFILAD